MTDYTNWEEALFDQPSPTWDSTLCHHGTKGQKWGRRRYQNEDGSLTPAGREHYGVGEGRKAGGLKGLFKSNKKKVSEMTDDELRKAIERNNLEKQYRESKPSIQALNKVGEIGKTLYEQYSANKKAASDEKEKKKALVIREKEIANEAKKAEAERLKNAAEYNKQLAEYEKWHYYTDSWKGRRTLKKIVKGERAKNEAELVKAKTEKKKTGLINRFWESHYANKAAKRKISQLDKELELQESRNVASDDVFNTQRQKTIAEIAKYITPSSYTAFANAFMRYGR